MSLKYAITCPGQGFVRNGLLQTVLAHKPLFKHYLEEVDATLNEKFTPNLFETHSEIDAKKWIGKTSNAQPAIVASSYILSKVIESTSHPQLINESLYILGHSLGEYSALLLSGILDFPTAIGLVRLRGQLMEQMFEGKNYGMAAVLMKPTNFEQVKSLAQDNQLLGNINSTYQIVLSGEDTKIQRLIDELKNRKLITKSVKLPVWIPFHSPELQNIVPELSNFLNGKINKQNKPIISNLTGKVSTNEVETVENTLKANYQPVQWLESMKFLETEGVNKLYNLGPGNVLHLINSRYNIECINLDGV